MSNVIKISILCFIYKSKLNCNIDHIIIGIKAKKMIINFDIFENTSYNLTSAENDKTKLCL